MELTAYKNSVWKKCFDLFNKCIQNALEFAENGLCEAYESESPAKTEYAVNSRYLHRGFYCPSPVHRYVVSNSRKGKILKRLTKRSQVTHLYKYNTEGNIYYIEYYIGDYLNAREYIVWEDNIRYGYIFNHSRELSAVSAEIYEGGLLREYAWTYCYNFSTSRDGWQAFEFNYEAYTYTDSLVSSFVFCRVALIEEDFNLTQDASQLVDLEKYRTICENDQIVDIRSVAWEP